MCGWLITLADDNYHVVSFLLNIENRVHHYYALQYVLIKIIYERNISIKIVVEVCPLQCEIIKHT